MSREAEDVKVMNSAGRRVTITLGGRDLEVTGDLQTDCMAVPYDDITGCDLLHDCDQLMLVVSVWQLKKSMFRHRLQRKKQNIRLRFVCGDHFKTAEKFALDIRAVTTGPAFHDARNLDGADRLLIFVNPFSGTKTAMKTFLSICSPILKSANIRFELVRTEYSGHAKDMMIDLDLSRYIGIVLMSGDGLAFEVLNGLIKRDDAHKSISTPIGFLPGGSGNALCSSICYANSEPLTGCLATTASLLLTKHRVTPCDLMAAETATDTYVAMLSFNWGLIADIDIESEKYRNIGALRFTLGTVLRLAGLRKYRAKISYVPATNEKLFSRRGITGDHPEMPQLNKDLPEEWKTFEESEFIMLLALNHSHLSSDVKGPFQNLRYNDGYMHLMVITGNITRARLTKNLLAMEDGNELKDPNIHLLAVTAFRLVPEPGSSEGINVLDGEKIPSGAIQLHTMPSTARIMVDSRVKTAPASK